jgi:hypothetical protein
MTTAAVDVTRVRAGRIAGALYLATLAAGVLGFAVRSSLLAAGDVTGTARNIVDAERLFRITIVTDMVTLSGVIVLAWGALRVAQAGRARPRNTVASDYFRALRIAIVAGRPFADTDDERSRAVVMVNHTFAQRFWQGAANAIGKRVRIGEGNWRTIVGVAADVKYLRVNESPRPNVYLPFCRRIGRP